MTTTLSPAQKLVHLITYRRWFLTSATSLLLVGFVGAVVSLTEAGSATLTYAPFSQWFVLGSTVGLILLGVWGAWNERRISQTRKAILGLEPQRED